MYAFLSQWVSGSVGQWVSGSVGQWVYGSVGQWVYESMDLWVNGSKASVPKRLSIESRANARASE